MDLPTQFQTFLSNIEPTDYQRDEFIRGHRTLRQRLDADADLEPYIITHFLQGSYRRSTAIRPRAGKKSDVDVVVVTNLNEAHYTPHDALELFQPFMERHYPEKWKFNGRSIGIELSYVELDLVVTSAPSARQAEVFKSFAFDIFESEEQLDSAQGAVAFKSYFAKAASEPWRSEPLLIPDRDAREWQRTHPLETIRWTTDKNQALNKQFVRIVKALKWWRRQHDAPKYPKGYPIEHLVGDACPEHVGSIAEGVTRTLETLRDGLWSYAQRGEVPVVPARGVPEVNVLSRLTPEDFVAFFDLIDDAATTARQAYDEPNPHESALLWRSLFGNRFPLPPVSGGTNGGGSTTGGFTERTSSGSGTERGRFA
ncbi:hypothetical protein HNQ07_004067 [Deinococcus metalli]|uniref:Nucleotidyltransferase n=1 Tax=Deinococcus metalli TaxID=1141878 RepID=A0A7W8NS46_9DEIO|nr:nucleotidyltransferase [Deinococcus metalli]MBB5378560.1 hypothetical protein [Deinococcus metalli]GHF58618.1 nucleotidyltransferase [Deinococcus metalli]